MSEAPSLIIFDCDGTLVDSAGLIVAAMGDAFEACNLARPTREDVRRIVGLSLGHAVSMLLNRKADEAEVANIADAYRSSYVVLRDEKKMPAPLFDGTQHMLEDLMGRGTLMGVATGKSLKGLQSLYAQHDLARFFVTSQTADFHPSKPHPSMVEKAMADVGGVAARSVMVGDTSYDIEMGCNAGVRTIGVAWGNHEADELAQAGADIVIDDWAALTPLLAEWELVK